MVILSAMLCCFCWGAPDWPRDGAADREWVVEALQWRLRRGLDDCGDVVPAMDAMTLEWISQSPEFTLHVNKIDWPFLNKVPELLPVLIQVKALDLLLGEVDSKKSQRRALLGVRRVARKTKELPFGSIRSEFRLLLKSGDYECGHGSNE